MSLSEGYCSDCYYYDLCDHEKVCEYYYPVGEDVTDAEIEDMIERNRVEFRSEWYEYINS